MAPSRNKQARVSRDGQTANFNQNQPKQMAENEEQNNEGENKKRRTLAQCIDSMREKRKQAEKEKTTLEMHAQALQDRIDTFSELIQEYES